MKCKDCIHYDVCKDIRNYYFMFGMESRSNIETACRYFKDKSKIVELQCKELDVLYSLCDMVFQFSYETTFCRKDALSNAGLSALEQAFSALEDSGLKINSNGTIQVHNLIDFMQKIEKKKSEAEAALEKLKGKTDGEIH